MPDELAPGETEGQQISDSALNGLQIENLTAIVMRVATGQIPVSVGRAIAKAAFPLMDESHINEIFPDSLEDSQPVPPKSAGGLEPVKELPTGVDKDLKPDEVVESILEGKYSHISFSPPASVRSAAKRGLELRKKYGRGGTAVGIARARDLSNGKEMSPSTIKRMTSFFARHEVDKKGEGWGKDSNGYIAWLLWGGDAGWSWAKKVARQMEAADKKN